MEIQPFHEIVSDHVLVCIMYIAKTGIADLGGFPVKKLPLRIAASIHGVHHFSRITKAVFIRAYADDRLHSCHEKSWL